jgi:hypothetical protein
VNPTFESGNRLAAMAGGFVFVVWLLGALCAVAQEASATKTNTASSDTSPTDYNNWFTLGAGGLLASGDRAQAQHQLQMPERAFGGVEDFHYQQFVGKKGLFQADGRGIFDNHDYSVRLELLDPDLGYLRGGYTEFRTWYDGNGGFFPQNSQWFSLYDNELHVDRGDAWFEGGLTFPDKPSFTFRYDHEFRRGEKDSTSWGDTTLTGGAGTRNIVPTFRGIDETRDVFQADIKSKLGNTDAGLGLRYEIDHNYDSINVDRSPGQPANRYVTQQNGIDNDLFNAHGFTETRLNQKVTLSLGGSFTTIDTDLSGSRIYGPSYNSPFSTTYPNSQRFDEGFTGLTGGGNLKEYVANVNLMATPSDNFAIIPALRIEYDGSDASSSFSDNTVAATGGAITPYPNPVAYNSDEWYLDVAESLEARYTGFRNWSLYARGEWSEDNGNTVWNETGVATPLQNEDWSRLGQKYTLGANWYPFYRLNFGAQYYHQNQNYDYDNNLTNSSITYPGYLRNEDFTVDDMNIRVTWRPFSTLSLVTRYDFQYSTVDTTSLPDNGTAPTGPSSEVQSANFTSHVISQSVSWTPFSRLYMQVSGSYVLNSLDTPAQAWMGVTNLVPNLANDYWTVNAMAGYALDEKTDLQLQYSIYRANDYVNNSTYSQPYGAGAEEQSVTATLSRQLAKAIKVSLKYGFFHNRDETSGWHNNYDAHLVFASMQYRF